MNLIMLGHLFAVICHYMSELLTKNGRKVSGGWFMLAKIFSYIFVHFNLQSSILFDDCRDGIVDESQVMAWLSYEVVAFYLNIVAMSVFLLLSSFKKFYSIRDRLGFSLNQRKKNDFLNYCKDDIHWFCAWFTALLLTVMALTMRTRSHEEMKTSVGVLMTRHFLEIVLLAVLYFSPTFEMKTYIKAIIGFIFVINLVMIKVFVDIESTFTVYWAPVLLLDIVLHFYIFIYMAIDYYNWDSKIIEWKKELMF